MSMQKKSPPRLWSFNQGHAWLALLLVVLIQIPPPATGQPVAPEVDPENNKSVATIMGIVALMFLLSCFLSLYSNKCTNNRQGATFDLALPTGRSGRRSQNEPCSGGLNQEVIDTFPTFRYSNVKGLKIGKSTLACAVCLNEFQDDETLRLIPKCSHVYHRDCIDVWLVSHSTCPVCRANLLPRPDDTAVVSIQMPEDHELSPNEEEPAVGDTGGDHKRDSDVESPKVDLVRRCRTMNNYQNRPTRSRSTGFLSALMFPRSNSMGGGHSVLVQPGEDCERFTLRLPEEVRNQMLDSTLKRAKSCVSFTRMSSGTWGYRTRSVGCGCGRGYVQHERFASEEQWGLNITPPNFVKNGWNNNRSVRKGKSPVRCPGVTLDNNVGERSSDLLCPRS